MSDPDALPVVPLPDPAEAPPAMMIDTEIVGWFQKGADTSDFETRINKSKD